MAIVDAHVNENPSAEQMAELTMLAAEEMRRFTCSRAQPAVAFQLRHQQQRISTRIRKALEILREDWRPTWKSMAIHGDTALDSGRCRKIMPDTPLKGDANICGAANLDANISYDL